jgi:hypothetical protein
VKVDILRARKRSSERIAMALMRSTATAQVSGLLHKCDIRYKYRRRAHQGRRRTFRALTSGGVVREPPRRDWDRDIGGAVAAYREDSCRS